MPKLIIFDCDGVLVDSEPLSNQIIADIMTEIGIPNDKGRSDPTICRRISSKGQ